jgi:hypothetical protein
MIAFRVTSESDPVDLVHAPGTVSHLQVLEGRRVSVCLRRRVRCQVRSFTS